MESPSKLISFTFLCRLNNIKILIRYGNEGPHSGEYQTLKETLKIYVGIRFLKHQSHKMLLMNLN
jgi:hypothetical protein